MITRTALSTILGLGMLAFAAYGQPKTSDTTPNGSQPKSSDTTPLTTDLPANTRKSRDQLVKSIERLRKQIEVTDDLLGVLQKNNDGSQETRSKICLLALRKELDRTTMTNPVAASLEHLRFAMDKEALGLQGLVKRRELDVQATQTRIDRSADKILTLEDELSQITDPEERQLAEEHLGERKAEMQEQIKLREERIANVKEYQKAVADLQREKKSLQAIERFLARESRLGAIRVERLRDAVQHGDQEVLRQQSEEGRKTLQAATELIRKIKDVPVSLAPTVPSAPRTILNPTRPEPAPVVLPSYQVEEELKKARERRGNAK